MFDLSLLAQTSQTVTAMALPGADAVRYPRAMARLTRGTHVYEAPYRCLIGRSSLADLRLESRQVSSEHARLAWDRERWLLRDLGSSNGTFVNKRRLLAGDSKTLAVGDVIHFASDGAPWRVEDLSPPRACAVQVDTGERITGTETTLNLPKGAPELGIVRRDGAWWSERNGDEVEVASGTVVSTTAHGRWRLVLPPPSPADVTATMQPQLDLHHAMLCFAVSPDEERVCVSVEHEQARLVLPIRACLYTLLVLARQRGGAVPGSNGTNGRHDGWMYTDELAELMKVMPAKVNVDIHRIRRLLTEASVQNSESIVERRFDTHQIRIGISRLRFESL